LIPMLNDEELENILRESRKVGAVDAGYVLLRLPLELHDLFREWLHTHEPMKAERVLNRIYEARGGKAYDSSFGKRMTGTGEYAGLLGQRFKLAYKRLAYPGAPDFNLSLFRPPLEGGQMDLFW